MFLLIGQLSMVSKVKLIQFCMSEAQPALPSSGKKAGAVITGVAAAVIAIIIAVCYHYAVVVDVFATQI
jgi:hypothetical protein